MKKIILFFFVFSCYISFAHAGNIEIKKQHQKIFSLSKSTLELYRDGSLGITSSGSFSLSCRESGCYTTTQKYGSFSGEIIISYKEKIKSLPIDFFIAYPTYFSLSHKIIKTYQDKALSCEISAAQDVMNYLGKTQYSEDELILKIPKSQFNKTPYEENWYKIWGNPEAWFVGYIHELPDGTYGSQYKYTGYGVLEKPIQELYKTYGYKTLQINAFDYSKKLSKNTHLTLLLQQLYEGNMVQMWGDYFCDFDITNATKTKTCTQSKSKNRVLEWYYKDDYWNLFKHTGLSGEHAFYLLGYRGHIENPHTIIVWDTMFWELEIPIAEWYRKWEMMQNRSVVIYKK